MYEFSPVMTEVRCPDCKLFVELPLTFDGHEVVIDDSFRGDFEQHVMAAPELHPTFTVTFD